MSATERSARRRRREAADAARWKAALERIATDPAISRKARQLAAEALQPTKDKP
jgi:hypothetical protein